MAHATINGARLWYDVQGDASRAHAPILLHHGYTASRVNWQTGGRSADEAAPRDHDGVSRHRRQRTHRRRLHAGAVRGRRDRIGGSPRRRPIRLRGAQHGRRRRLRAGADLSAAPRAAGADGIGAGGRFPEQRSAHARDASDACARNRDRATLLAQYRATCVRPDVETDAWFNSRIDHIFGVSDGHFDGGAESMRTLNVGAKLGSITLPTLSSPARPTRCFRPTSTTSGACRTRRCRCSRAPDTTSPFTNPTASPMRSTHSCATGSRGLQLTGSSAAGFAAAGCRASSHAPHL